MHSEANEYQKLNRLKNKDLVAFSWMYATYSPALYMLILKAIRDTNEADSILLKSFKRMWKKIESYDEAKSSLFIWMAQITFQNCYNSDSSVAIVHKETETINRGKRIWVTT